MKNIGNTTVDSIVVKDVMPASLKYTSSTIVSNHTADLEMANGNENFLYKNLTLKVGDTFVFEVVGVVKTSPDQNATTNCAVISSHNVGPACVSFDLSPKPFLDKMQRVNAEGSYVDGVLKVKTSDVINYKIVFKNTGSATAHNVVLVDKLPRCVAYVN